MDDDRAEDEDRIPLAAVATSRPHRTKAHSYSQQLRTPTNNKRHHQIRKYSLEEERIPNNLDRYQDSYDDDFVPYMSNSARISSDSLSQKIDQSLWMDDPGDVRQSMPEFSGAGGGGGVGVFKVPTRASVHPGRPTCLELRPHPLKETQVNKCLRTIGCTETQLWAGQENGVRYWNFADSYEAGCGLGGKVKRGDEDAAPFQESHITSPTHCLIVDKGNRLVWTGHKDGKIRSWKTDENDIPLKEGLSWQAHRGPVLSIVITSYGDIWTGFEGGVIKIWPWETIQKSLSFSPEEKHMAALLVERSFIDLKSQVTFNGVCSISSQDVKCLLVDTIRAKVWCANPLSFSIWDARTKELIKVFNIDGQIENRVDPSQVHDRTVEDEMKVKFVSAYKKEKSQGFFQRSRNAINDAVDAVRKVASKSTSAFQEDHKRTEAMVLSFDGMIWSGCANGLLVQWDGNGNRLQEFNLHPCAVLCFCTLGTRIYVGYVSGMVQVIDLEGNVVAGWVAHSSPVIKLAVGSGYIYSLATHGGIRGWNFSSPGPLDSILRADLAGKESEYTRRANTKILVGTWNVGQGKPFPESLHAWLASAASDVGIIVVGLQEVEMGAGFLAMSAAKETIGMEGSPGGQAWLDTIGKALDEGTTFERMGSRQLAGLLISLWVRKSIRMHVGDVDAGAVPCGFGRAIGNKGAVGLRIRVYDRIMCFVNCHFAAHLEAVNRRNGDFDHCYRNLAFTRSSTVLSNASAGVSSAAQGLRAANANPEDVKAELSEADMVVFLGDFNYRLHSISYDEARDFVSQRCFDWLREKDQLRAEMKAGKVFQGMREAIIRFPPTYKFERHQAGLAGYDSGEKKRIPAWCDRILYRDNRLSMESECSLECPVVASILQYEAVMEVTDSDHKPVRCKFYVQISHVDRSVRRQGYGDIVRSNEKIRSIFEELRYVPETSVSTNNVTLQNQDTSILRITNKCSVDVAIFQIICEGHYTVEGDGEAHEPHSQGFFGFPRWLEVTPGAGIINPDQSVEIAIHHEETHTLEELVDGIPQNWWSEDTRDKEVTLVVSVRGSRSTESRSHRIRVRHCFSAKTLRIDSKSSNNSSNNSKKAQVSPPHRSEFQRLSHSSSDMDDDLRHFH